MNRITLLLLLLLAQPTFGQSLKERLEAEASALVAEILSDTVQATLISEGGETGFAACVGQYFAQAYKDATDEQRQSGIRTWLDGGKRQCSSVLASEDSSNTVEGCFDRSMQHSYCPVESKRRALERWLCGRSADYCGLDA